MSDGTFKELGDDGPVVAAGGQALGVPLVIGTQDAQEVDVEAGGVNVVYVDGAHTKLALKSGKHFKSDGGAADIDWSASSGLATMPTGDFAWPGASGKVFKLGVSGSGNLPRLLLATSHASLVYADGPDEATFNGTVDRLKRSDAINLNTGGNYIDATQMSMEWTCEHNYDIGNTSYTGGAITGATNATPIVVTTTSPHGLTSNDTVDISGVTGNTAANGTGWAITKLTATTFSLTGSVGNGVYGAGGAVVAHRLTLERYQAFQKPGSNGEVRPFGATFNNDGLYSAFGSFAGDYKISNTDSTAQRLTIPEAADGVDVTMQLGTIAHGGVSVLVGKNNIAALSQTDSAGNSRELLKLDNAGGGTGANDVLNLAGGVNKVFIGGDVTFLKQTARTIKINDATDATFNGGDLTVQAGKGATSGKGGNLNLYAGGSPSGTKGSVVLGDSNTLDIEVAVPIGSTSGTLKLFPAASTSSLNLVQTSGTSLRFDGTNYTDLHFNTRVWIQAGLSFDAAWDIGANGATAGTLFCVGVAIGGTLSSKALIDLQSTTKGFLPPRMTTTQRDAITSVPEGLVVYNTTTHKLNVFTTAWEAVTSA